jgi:hypothetical protein
MSAGGYDPDQSAVDTRRIQPWSEAFRVGAIASSRLRLCVTFIIHLNFTLR